MIDIPKFQFFGWFMPGLCSWLLHMLDIPDISNFLAIFRPAKVAFVLWKTQNNSRILYIQRFLLLGVGGGTYI